MHLSQVLTKLMNETGVTAYKISKDTGISNRLIGYWRDGEKLPGAENLLNIANYFNVSVDYLLTGKETPLANEGLKPEERQFINKFNRLEPIDKGKILERMDVIYESYPPAAVQEPQDGFSEPAEPTAASLDQKKHLA